MWHFVRTVDWVVSDYGKRGGFAGRWRLLSALPSESCEGAKIYTIDCIILILKRLNSFGQIIIFDFGFLFVRLVLVKPIKLDLSEVDPIAWLRFSYTLCS